MALQTTMSDFTCTPLLPPGGNTAVDDSSAETNDSDLQLYGGDPEVLINKLTKWLESSDAEQVCFYSVTTEGADAATTYIDKIAKVKAKLSYSSDSRLLVIHLPSAVHEFTAEKLGRFIGDELVANNLDEQVAEYATTTYHRRDGVPSRRQPDKSWLPMGLSTTINGPTVVLEVGFSQTASSLQQAVTEWLESYGAAVVITLRIKKTPALLLQKYTRKDVPDVTVNITEDENNSVQLAPHEAFTVCRFAELLGRRPMGEEASEIVLQPQVLMRLGRLVFACMRHHNEIRGV